MQHERLAGVQELVQAALPIEFSEAVQRVIGRVFQFVLASVWLSRCARGATAALPLRKLHRALGVTTAKRSDLLPELPAVAEFVAGYEASGWTGLVAPKNTPPALIGTINKQVNAALTDAKLKARLADLGATPLNGSPADFGKLIAEETEKWAKVIRASNIKIS